MKAAILGMGNMGQIHKETYESLGIVPLTYDPEHENEVSEWGAIEWPDVVSVCSPDNFHAEQIVTALNAGKHVFCEKPLCHTRREFEAIKAAYESKKGKCLLGMNFPLRWHVPFVDAHRRLHRGDIGGIRYIHAHYEYGRYHKMAEGWRGSSGDYSVVMGGGIHLIDWLNWAGLEIEPERASRCGPNNWVSVSLATLNRKGVLILTCDFTASGTHARRVWFDGVKDGLYIDDQEPTDKSRALREFIHYVKGGAPDPDMPTAEQIFRAHEIGLNM